MNATTSKDFGPIRDDYLFFQQYSTEADEDLRAYQLHLQAAQLSTGPLRMLDFGCGSGQFSSQFLAQARFAPERLWLSLVEPEAGYRHQARQRLQAATAHPVQAWPTLSPKLEAHFDLVLANHVFYYVPDLDAVLAGILRALTPNGLLLTALAGQRNILMQFLFCCFDLIGMPFPYHTAEDLHAALAGQEEVYRKQDIHYQLVFPDTEENRLKIMRFLLGEYFDAVPQQAMLELFNPYAAAGQIAIRTVHEQFAIRQQK